MKYSIDKVHHTRDLTPHEEVFLQGLAEYILFLDKSLFFQIDDLQKHTELVLSGETGTAYRYEFPDPDELEKEIEELEKMINDLVDKLEKRELPQEYWALLASDLPISIYAGHASKYGLDFVKKRQSHEGLSAAYGFGAYIFEKHKDDYYNLIPGYANVSRLLDKSDKSVLEYKYLVYPCYPSGIEETAYNKLLALLDGKASKGKVSSVPKVLPPLPSAVVPTGKKAVVRNEICRQFVLDVFMDMILKKYPMNLFCSCKFEKVFCTMNIKDAPLC